MAESVARVVVVTPSERNRDLLLSLLGGMDWILVEDECRRYEDVIDTLAKIKVDGVLIALDANPTTALQLIKQIIYLHPRISIIANSSRSDLLLQAHRLGAKALLEDPPDLEALSVALKNLSSGRSLNRPAQGKIIALLASRGGVGCTSLAVNLGCVWASDPGNQVVILDLDMVTGCAELALDLVPEFRLTDVVLNIERMDLKFLQSSLTRDKDGLALLARPLALQEVGLVEPDHVQRILKLMRVFSTHMIVDLSKGWLPTDRQALHLADIILLVVQPELTSARNAYLQLASLAEEEMVEKVRVILNRVGGDFGGEEISVKKIEEALNRPVYWQIPNDFNTMMVWNSGIPLIRSAPKSKVHQSILDLSQQLLEPVKRPSSNPSTPPPTRSVRSFPKLFPRSAQ